MRVTVVGGGATGAPAAVVIGRRLADRDAEVVVIDPAETIGPGLAYLTVDPRHLLNVRAANMSAFADAPDHFLDWLRRRPGGGGKSPFSVISRALYGDYVADVAREAVSPGQIRHIREYCLDIVERPDTVSLRLATWALPADHVVFATGHDVKPAVQGIPADPPWSAISLDGLDPQAAVLIDCTGLASDATRSPNPRIRALLARGALRPDPLRICLDVAEDFSHVDAHGARSRRIKTLRPLARATFWECIAIPDIRVQCCEVAEILASHGEQETDASAGHREEVFS